MKLTKQDKYHLHSRASFFSHTKDLVKTDNVDKAVDHIFKRQEIKDLCLDIPKWNPKKNRNKTAKQRAELRKERRQQVTELNHLWVLQMMENNKGLIEKMTLFWHGHFACNTKDNPHGTMQLNNVLRTNALGNFRDLLNSVSKSPSMINYLHLRQNKKGKPNEDFARELCELFTLGRDVDYTEKDVTEIARAFTGWTFNEDGNHFVNLKKHDSGEKTIFGKIGNFGGEDVLNMILANKNCAKHIATKVYRFFVQEEKIDSHISELTDVLYQSNYEITPMMKYLFKAEWFYQTKGKIIKSPIELLVGLGKMFALKYTNGKSIIRIQHYLGHVLFEPPNVAGWAGGRQWIDASRFALRLRLGSLILNKGYLMDELSPELDAQIQKRTKKKDLVFFEEIDWNAFWQKNESTQKNPLELYHLIIRCENKILQKQYANADVKTIIKLVSTPDFQLA